MVFGYRRLFAAAIAVALIFTAPAFVFSEQPQAESAAPEAETQTQETADTLEELTEQQIQEEQLADGQDQAASQELEAVQEDGAEGAEGQQSEEPPVQLTAVEESVAAGLAVEAKSAVLLDADSGTVIFEHNSHEQLPPASVTKVMTMLLAMEAIDRGQISLSDEVTISQRAASMGGSQMYMEAGETQTVETLLAGMAIASANDACVAIAEYVGGTEEIFVENMNKRAKELGMEDTNFVNTNGLPVANHYTSAYDIGIMSKELLKYPQVQEWFNTWQMDVTVGLPGKETVLGLTNTNRMIRQYTGANGIKTGFTQEAGYCLSASATRDDLTLISVIMGGETSNKRFNEAGMLLDYGFATYDSVKLADRGDVIDSVTIEKGSPQIVNAVAGETISVLVKKGESQSVDTEVVLYENVKAPVMAGDVIGELILFKEGAEIGRYPLYAETGVGKAGFLELYIRMLKTLA